MNRTFPSTRLRRTRMSNFLRKLTTETLFTKNDLIWPVFITEGKNKRDEIKSMPLIYRYSIDKLISELDVLVKIGLQAVALFPHIENSKKDQDGSLALDPDNLVCRCIKEIKKKFPEIGIICDVALDPYTSHGHDGIIYNDQVSNDQTISILKKQALIQADAGCDILAPSDMMDGRVLGIRNSLEKNGFKNTLIMSYSAKYASCFFGPFREAIQSEKLIKPINKKSYQMNPANSNEAMHEVSMDISEGADMVIIKPGLPYLDIISKCKNEFKIPVFAYQVSGEYSMIMAAAKMGFLNLDDVIFESLICFKRAGSDGVFSYFTPYVLEEMNKKVPG